MTLIALVNRIGLVMVWLSLSTRRGRASTVLLLIGSSSQGAFIMRHITLSDHVTDQLDAAAAKRRAEYDAALARHHEALARRAHQAEQLRGWSVEAWRGRRYLKWLLSLLARLGHTCSARPGAPVPTRETREEGVWQAGAEGERRVFEACARHLSDDWILISGYVNAGGEVDQILVGPSGVLAIEVKFVNGSISCEGDSWLRDRFDRYGNLVESSLPIVDKKGRGPSAQVNAVADRLQAFLAARGAVERVARAVLFAHDASRLGRIVNPTVDLVATLSQFDARASLVGLLPGPAGAVRVEEIVRLIRRDHLFHARRHDQPARRVAPPSTWTGA